MNKKARASATKNRPAKTLEPSQLSAAQSLLVDFLGVLKDSELENLEWHLKNRTRLNSGPLWSLNWVSDGSVSISFMAASRVVPKSHGKQMDKILNAVHRINMRGIRMLGTRFGSFKDGMQELKAAEVRQAARVAIQRRRNCENEQQAPSRARPSPTAKRKPDSPGRS